MLRRWNLRHKLSAIRCFFVLVHANIGKRKKCLYLQNIVFVKACHFCKIVFKMIANIKRMNGKMNGWKKNYIKETSMSWRSSNGINNKNNKDKKLRTFGYSLRDSSERFQLNKNKICRKQLCRTLYKCHCRAHWILLPAFIPLSSFLFVHLSLVTVEKCTLTAN